MVTKSMDANPDSLPAGSSSEAQVASQQRAKKTRKKSQPQHVTEPAKSWVDDKGSKRRSAAKAEPQYKRLCRVPQNCKEIDLLHMEPFPLLLVKNEAYSCGDEKLSLSPLSDLKTEPQISDDYDDDDDKKGLFLDEPHHHTQASSSYCTQSDSDKSCANVDFSEKNENLDVKIKLEQVERIGDRLFMEPYENNPVVDVSTVVKQEVKEEVIDSISPSNEADCKHEIGNLPVSFNCDRPQS